MFEVNSNFTDLFYGYINCCVTVNNISKMLIFDKNRTHVENVTLFIRHVVFFYRGLVVTGRAIHNHSSPGLAYFTKWLLTKTNMALDQLDLVMCTSSTLSVFTFVSR